MTRLFPDHPLPKAPTYQELPTAKSRAVRGGPERIEIRVRLEVITPIFGGSHQTRAIDKLDVIRVPSVRGHLRFWWRALYAARYENSEDLYEYESALWGRAAIKDGGGRSRVEIRVNVEREGIIDTTDIRLNPGRDQQATPGAYALWPAREEKKTNTPAAPRRKPGTQFQLTLKVFGTEQDAIEVKNALRAWILFGGYGGRTRRGLGSLTVIDNGSDWLPTAATREAIKKLFGFDIFAAPTGTPGDVPWLPGASLHVRPAERDAQTAWTTALDWLREFRQGTNGKRGERAREPGPQPNRPSISNWPEADKIRHLMNKTRAHKPRHNATPVWPRAGFGLPIIGQFQTTDRHGNRRAYDEPGPYEIRWRAPKVGQPQEFDEHDRFASPLIVKALPLVDDKFVPCALWLNRSYPDGAEVGLARGRPRKVDPATVASFDRLVASGDTAHFAALENKTSLRRAFLDWLHTTYQTTVVAP